MEVIDRIPVALDPAAVAERLRHNPTRASSIDLDGLLAQARSLIRLRAVAGISFTGAKTEDTVVIDGVTFRSRVLRRNLDRAQKVFPFVVTAGPDLERAASSSGDLLSQYYLEEMANVALENAAAWLAGRLGTRWGFPSLASMDPGSLEDWPITEQPKLFSLLGDTERLIGVRLTDSMLMLPRKSISGIFFPSEEGFTSCRLCERAACPGRRTPYDPAVAAKYERGGGAA
ncbi:MAG: vitamin B12 dependent-methionine synthase activation domain-containing protein [Acidobacteriota bacterium]